jgi:glycosyltransferase involved in cell wall biosynthesis
MKILLVTHHKWSKSFARPAPIGEYLARAGHDVTLLCTSDNSRMRWKEDIDNGIRIIQAPDLLWGRLRSGWDMWGGLHKTFWMKRHLGEFDVVHLFETRPSVILPFRLARAAARGPVIIDWNDWWGGKGGIIDSLRPGWYRKTFGIVEAWFETYYRDSADGSTVISSALERRVLDMGVDRRSVMRLTGGTRPEAFAAKSIRECRKETGFPADGQIIGFSSLDSHIDLELVLDALVILAEIFPKVSLLVTGRPSKILSTMAEERGVLDRVHQTGFVPFELLTTYLGAANVCVLPLPNTAYNRGRWPNKITDYATAGRPVVTNPVGDMADLVRENDMGLLTDWNKNDFAAAIESLLLNPDEADRLGKNARLAAESGMKWSNRIQELEEFYVRLIDRHKSNKS